MPGIVSGSTDTVLNAISFPFESALFHLEE